MLAARNSKYMKIIDLNCDLGEAFGPWPMGNDEVLMDFVSSVNVACGFHAGDPSVMMTSVALAIKKNVAIGAHPGYPDLQGFGRRSMKMTSREVYDVVLYQVSALYGMVKAAGGKLRHVKPHGALYNDAAVSPALAASIAAAVRDLDNELIFVGLAGSALVTEAKRLGLRTAEEAFADRTYRDDGTLTSRREANALVPDAATAAAQALMIVREGKVKTTSGQIMAIAADTLCIHGDRDQAPEFVREIANTLNQHGFVIGSW